MIQFSEIKKMHDADEYIDSWLDKAGENNHHEAHYCHKENDGRDFYIIMSEDYGSEKAVRLFQQNLRARILEEPKNWFFIIENSTGICYPEINHYLRVADLLGIRRNEIFYRPFSPRVTRAGCFDEAETLVAATIYGVEEEQAQATFINLSQFEVGERYQELFALLRNANKLYPELLDKEEAYYAGLWDYMKKVSHAKAHKNLERILLGSPENIFAGITIGNLPIFERDYSRDFRIPKKYRQGNTTLPEIRFDYFIKKNSKDELENALEIAKETGSFPKIVRALEKLYDLYSESDNPADVLEAIEIADELEDEQKYKQALLKGVRIHEEIGDIELALMFREELENIDLS